jgi:hypothetical protein
LLTWYPYLRGIFDVNMPLLYGEGEKAFTRLQEEILKENDDQSVFAWSPVSADTSSNILNYVDVRELRQQSCIPIFAKHPRNFAQAKDIYAQDPLGEPPTITNKGVRIDLPILGMESVDVRAKTHYFLAVLYCGYFNDKGKHPAIILRRFVSESGSYTYMRYNYTGIFAVAHDEVRSSDIRQVYLRKRRLTGPGREHLQYETSSMAKLYERVVSTEPRVYQLKDDNETRRAQYQALQIQLELS